MAVFGIAVSCHIDDILVCMPEQRTNELDESALKTFTRGGIKFADYPIIRPECVHELR